MPDIQGPNHFDDMALLRAIIGDEKIFDEVLHAFGGSKIYFPHLDRRARAERIRRAFQDVLGSGGLSVGAAIRSISQREGLSYKQVQRIVVIPKKNKCE